MFPISRTEQLTDTLNDPHRLEVLHQLGLLDTPAEHSFDRLTRLATMILGKPVSLVSLVDSDRQFFKSFVGLDEPWASAQQTPLSHSFCQHVMASNEPLIIEDARQHPLVKDNMAITDLNVIAYLGMPLTLSTGEGLGSFCVIDNKPHHWTDHEIVVVRELAASVLVEIELRAELSARRIAETKLQTAYIGLEERSSTLRRVTEFCRSIIDQMIDATQRGASKPEMLKYLLTAQRELDKRV